MSAPSSDETSLSQKAAQCRPPWDGYDEALKQCLGAQPTAEWRGAPTGAAMRDGDICVEFRVEGAWSKRACLPPMLLRDPLGNTLASWRSENLNGLGKCWFRMPTERSAMSMPWVEIRFPGGTQRVVPASSQ
jgi:hypothetical protein